LLKVLAIARVRKVLKGEIILEICKVLPTNFFDHRLAVF